MTHHDAFFIFAGLFHTIQDGLLFGFPDDRSPRDADHLEHPARPVSEDGPSEAEAELFQDGVGKVEPTTRELDAHVGRRHHRLHRLRTAGHRAASGRHRQHRHPADDDARQQHLFQVVGCGDRQ